MYISNVYHFVGKDGTNASGEHIDFLSNYVSLIQQPERSHLAEAGTRFVVADHDSLSSVLIRRIVPQRNDGGITWSQIGTWLWVDANIGILPLLISPLRSRDIHCFKAMLSLSTVAV